MNLNLIDLHTHTFFSDGVLSPAELAYRCKLNGLKAIALSDHVDYSNMKGVIEGACRAGEALSKKYRIKVIPGVELTYIPPGDIFHMVREARSIGAQVVVVHGETVAENVPPGTNIAAIEAGCDILAHPGILSDAQAKRAREKEVFIELTTRGGHREANPQVAESALKHGCRLVLNTDGHRVQDILDMDKVLQVLKQCGLNEDDYRQMLKNSEVLVNRAGRKI